MKHITHTREQFGIQVQNELDIDSDTEVFKFLAKNKSLTFSQLLEFIYDCQEFGFEKIRISKFARFVGGLIGPKIYEKYGVKIIAFPFLNQTIISNQIDFACISDGRKLATVSADIDFLKLAHTNPKSLTKSEYVQKLETQITHIGDQIYSQLLP